MTYTKKEETYTLPYPYVNICCADFDTACYTVFLERTGREYGPSNSCNITIHKQASYDIEEYSLVVETDGINIVASSVTGVIMALTTLHQLISNNGIIRCCNIHDKPRYLHRGLSLDCARQFYPVSDIKNIIEQMSKVKLNTLHWHLTNDQAWRIESTRYPKLHQKYGSAYYSQADIRDIVSYASLRGIEIVPEIDMPGHTIGLLASYPDVSCFGKEVKPAEYGGVYATVLCAGNENTYSFIESLLDEICPLFPSPRFHIGGDEVPKHEWRKCIHCQEKMKELNLDEVQLQGYFSNRIIEVLKKHNKQAICWNDSLEATNFNNEAAIQYWTVQHEDSMPGFIQMGGQVIYSEMFSFYFDYPHSMTPLKRVYQDPIEIMGKDCTDSIIGIEACLWAEHIPTVKRLGEQLFPRLYAIAERAWSHEHNYPDFIVRLSRFMEIFHLPEVSFTPKDKWDPQGQTRQQDMLAHMGVMAAAMPTEIREETMRNITLNKSFQEKYNKSFFVLEEDMPILERMRMAQ